MNLHSAFERRQISDYQVVAPVQLEDVKAILTAARFFVEHVNEWIQSQCLVKDGRR